MKALSLVFLLTAPLCAAAGALDQWQWRSPNPDHGNLFDCVTFQNGLFVAAGLGVLSTSSDGVHWTNRNPGTVYEIQSIAYGNGGFVGVGTGRSYTSEQSFGVVVTSSDAIHWTEHLPAIGVLGFNDVAFGAGTFIAVGPRAQGNAILSSTNGVVWTLRNQSGVNDRDRPTNDWQTVTFGFGKFATTGINYDYPSGGRAPMMTSPNGIDWYVRDSNSSSFVALNDIIYANGKFVAVGGGVLLSTNGVNWAQVSPRTGFDYGLAYGNGLFVSVGTRIRTSPNAITWSDYASPTTNLLKSVAYGNGIFVAVGWGVMLSSSNGVDWVPVVDLGTPPVLTGVVYGNEQFVAVGSGGSVRRSSDGAEWTASTTGTSSYLSEVIWAEGKFVASSGRGNLLTSSNGSDWVARNPGFTNYDALAYGNGIFVAAATDYGLVFTSSDGLDWVKHDVGSSFHLGSIAYGSGTFLGTGLYLGTVVTSPDGVQWSEHHTGATNTPMAVAYGKGIFTVLGTGFAQISSDGVNWSPVRFLPPWFFPRRAIYAQGTFICVGDYGLIASSTNGLDWTTHNSGTSASLWGLTYGRHTVVAVGVNGTILQSAPLELPPVELTASENLPGGGIRISLNGSSGQSWQLQSSADLAEWTPLAELILTNNYTEFIDFAVTNLSPRFYRAISP